MNDNIIEKLINIDEIKPYENNVKRHSDQQIDKISKSIQEYGFIQKIVIDENNIIIIGHGRYYAAMKLGLKEIPCVILKGFSETKLKKLRILDNKLNESEWDLGNLKLELDEIDDIELNKLFPEFDAPEFNPDDYEDNAFQNHINNNATIFTINLSFDKSYQETIENYIKTQGKGILEEKIIDLIINEQKGQ